MHELEEETDFESETEKDQFDQQNKANINELPDSCKFIYDLETKIAKKVVKMFGKIPKLEKK